MFTPNNFKNGVVGWTDVVFEVVRTAVNNKFPTLMPTLYPDSKATDPRPYASLDDMWRVLVT